MSSGLLLDTHVFLWWQLDDAQLSVAARARIAAEARVFVSAASVWEASIKASLGKLELPEPISAALGKHGFLPLPITCLHAEAASRLPYHHRDPFDRMLIAQAQTEGLLLVTHDMLFKGYDVNVLWT